MKKWIIFLLVTAFFDIIFFRKLFFPQQQLIITPEWSGGDSVVLQLPWKKSLCDNFKKGEIALWNKNMGFGWPLLAESEVGALNPINLLTCLASDYKTAYNLQFIAHIFIFQIGMFILAIKLKLKQYSQYYLPLIVPFIPIMIFNYMHLSWFVAFCYFPLIIASFINFIERINVKSTLIFVGCFVLQVLSSHIQMVFFTLVCIYLLFIIHGLTNRIDKTKLLSSLFWMTIAVILSGLIAAPQLFPTIEFLANSDRGNINNFGSFSVRFDQNLTIGHMITLISPFIFGDPTNGTYQFRTQPHPWESNFFIYYTPLFFLIVFLVKIKKIIKTRYVKELIILWFALLLIALGKNSPISFIQGIPPFVFFRFPNRFALLMVFLLLVFSSYGFNYLVGQLKTRLQAIIFLATIFLFFFESSRMFNYFHVLRPAQSVFPSNRIMDFIQGKRLYTPYEDFRFMEIPYEKYGYFYHNFDYLNLIDRLLLPNVNVVYQTPSLIVKTGPNLSRAPYFYNAILDASDEANLNIKSETDRTYYFGNSASNILKMAGVDYILTASKLQPSRLLIPVIEDSSSDPIIQIYRLDTPQLRLNFTTQLRLVNSVGQFKKIINEGNYQNLALIEDQNLIDRFSSLSENRLINSKIILDEDQKLLFQIETNKNGFLTVADTYYPGWHAYVDGKETKIYRANLMFRGIVLPKGNHTVEFKYIPHSFYLGLAVSAATSLCLTVVFILKRKRLS